MGDPEIEIKPSEESLLLASNIHKLIYSECAPGWNNPFNPEPDEIPYREVPKRPTSITKESVGRSRVKEIVDKTVNTLRIITSTEPAETAKKMARPNLKNRGWRVVVQKEPEKNNVATILYSGEYPTSKDFGPHHSGLKIFHADKNRGLMVAFLDDFITPDDKIDLGNAIREYTIRHGDWRAKLRLYDNLLTHQKIAVRKTLEFDETPSTLFTAIRSDFLFRSMVTGTEFIIGK